MTSIEKLILRTANMDEATKVASSIPNVEYMRKVSTGLEKVSSYQYKESTYNAVRGIMKIASDLLNNAVDSYQASSDRVSELEKVSSIRSIVDDMVDSGIVDRFSAQEKIAELVSKSEDELRIVKEAMLLVSNDGEYGLFENEKTASVEISGRKLGMFDSVLQS